MEKTCRDCGQSKPTTEFHRDKARADGFAIRCKPCIIAMLAVYKMRPPRHQSPPGMKRCGTCKETKPETEFTRNKNFHDGLNRVCKPCCNARSAAYEQKHKQRLNGKQMERYYLNPERYADRDLRKRFGLPLGQYAIMLAAQGGKCAICGTTDPGPRLRRFCVDHNHVTGQMRGLLCRHCNNGIGLFGENTDTIRSAIDYLIRYQLPKGS